MTPENYLRERVDGQIGWYSDKSSSNKRAYISLKIVELIAAAIIPFIAGMKSTCLYWQMLLGLLGIAVTISAGISATFHFHENWITFRAVSESLKHEKYTYLAHDCDSQSKEAFEQFVQRVESLISKENSIWANRHNKQEKTSKGTAL